MAGWFHGVLLLSAKHTRGKYLTNGDSANHSQDQYFCLGRWSNITLFLPKTCRDFISSARKSFQEYSAVVNCTRGESGLAKIDASEIHARRLIAKEVLTPQNGEIIYNPNRRWNSQIIWRSGSENIHLNRGQPRPRRRTRKSSRRIRRVFTTTSRLIAG